MLYLHFLSFLCIFVSFHTFSLTYDYLKMFCLVSKCFDCFPIFLLLLYIFDSILLWSKNTICIMSRFVLWPRTWSYLVICCMDTWKECEFCCLGVEYSINTNYILFLMVVLFFFFLYPYGFSVWPVVEKGMLKFSFIIVNLSIFSFNSIMFLLHIFTAIFVYTGTVCLGRLSLLTLYNVLLCLWSFSFLRSLLYMIFT